MEFNAKIYKCSICGKQHVKLWRPYGDDSILICAECAEKRQSPIKYQEKVWSKEIRGFDYWYNGKPTGKELNLPRWKVDKEGHVPSYDGPGPKGEPQIMTDQLIVDLSDVSSACLSGNTTMIPAILNEELEFLCYFAAPKELYSAWQELPTR